MSEPARIDPNPDPINSWTRTDPKREFETAELLRELEEMLQDTAAAVADVLIRGYTEPRAALDRINAALPSMLLRVRAASTLLKGERT